MRSGGGWDEKRKYFNNYRMRSKFIKTKLSVRMVFFFFFGGQPQMRATPRWSRLIEWLKIRTKFSSKKYLSKESARHNSDRHVTTSLAQSSDEESEETETNGAKLQDISALVVVTETMIQIAEKAIWISFDLFTIIFESWTTWQRETERSIIAYPGHTMGGDVYV